MPNWTEYQKAVIEHKDNNLLVSAAAGSGKTAVMIEHIFKMITEEGSSLDRMIIATYTNTAAKSMKNKLNKRFIEAIKKDPENEHLLRQQQLIDRADISTIHAYCIKMLKKYYYRTLLPPDFRIFEGAQQTLLKNAAMADTLEECSKLYNDGLFPEYGEVLTQFASEKSDKSLERIILQLDKALKPIPHPENFKKFTIEIYENDGKIFEDFLIEESKNLLLCAIEQCHIISKEFNNTPIGSGVIEHTENYINFFQNAIEQKDLQKINEALKTLPDIRKVKELNKDKSPLKQRFVDSFEIVKKIRSNVQALTACDTYTYLSYLVPAIEGLFKIHEIYSKKTEEIMLNEGGTDFDGVLSHGLRLIEENEDIREDIKNNTDYIYIDEYQDENEFHTHIITSLSKGKNMFFVGDVKQSIYGFQDARPDMFRKKMDMYGQNVDGDLLILKNNFRSFPNILEGVNFLFKKYMNNKKISEIVYDSDACLYPSPEKDSPQYSDCLYYTDTKTPDECSNELMVTVGSADQESYMIALKIQELMKMSLYDNGKLRPLRYSDIAILGRNRTSGMRLMEIFKEMGIPYINQKKEPNDDTDTTVTIIALLNLLILRKSDVDLVTVMLSPIGGFTPTELAKVRAKSQKTSFYTALKNYDNEENIKKKIDDFFTLLDNLELIEKSMSLGDFIEYVANETGYVYHTSYMPKNSKEQEALKKLISLAREYSEFSDKGILGFLDYHKKLNEPDDPSFVIDENANSVHFMTAHKSKGLEFPVVILIGCSDHSSVDSDTVKANDNFGIAFDYTIADNYNVRTKFVSPGKLAINRTKKQQYLAEEMRVLYVALTRAKNKLIISVADEEKKLSKKCTPLSDAVLRNYSCFSDLLMPLFYYHKNASDLRDLFFDDRDLDLYDDDTWKISVKIGIDPPEAKKEEVIEDDFDKNAYLKKIKEDFSWVYPYASSTTQRTKQSPSKKAIRTKIPLRKPMFEDKEYKGAQKGTAVHFFMEHVLFDSEKSAREQAEDMLSSGILTNEEFEAIPFKQIDSFLNSPFGLRMKNSSLILRERSFCHIIPFDDTGDESLVQGIIDCYFFEGDDIVLLDYKTDYINGDLDEHVLHHTPQLKMYKAALEQLYPGRKVYPYIHFFHVDKTVEIV